MRTRSGRQLKPLGGDAIQPRPLGVDNVLLRGYEGLVNRICGELRCLKDNMVNLETALERLAQKRREAMKRCNNQSMTRSRGK